MASLCRSRPLGLYWPGSRVLVNKDQATIDPLDIDQWKFYVLSTRVLNEKLKEQKTVGLAALLKLGAARARFGEIASTVVDVVSN